VTQPPPAPRRDATLALLADVFEALPFAVVVVGAEGAILTVNREAELLLGYQRGELPGQPVEVLVPEPMRDAHASLHRRYLDAPVARALGATMDLLARGADGRLLPVEIALKPLGAPDGPIVIAAIVDVSMRRALEQRARDANAELERRVRERTDQLERSNRDKEAMVERLEQSRAELERLSREDALTGLCNRREFEARLAREQQRADRNRSPLCVAMLDVDHFKSVNDVHGHALGDRVLRQIAVLLLDQCRAIDVVARLGGEEFALALPDTHLDEACAICERVRHAVEAFDWPRMAADLQVTISLGVVMRGADEAAADALKRADGLLYDAKRHGRNRVESGSPA
jgi:diguanylate cyclase (GGDEF)-like protein/PAS domain S-box-containing protein